MDILILNEDGTKCGVGEQGELVHRGAFVTYGYLNDPDLTKEKFIQLSTGGSGCLPEYAVCSGDIVSRDHDGYIYFHGRRDAQIKSNGYRVSPGEVEEAALLFTGISHAAVFGLPDEDLGQSVNLAYATYHGDAADTTRLMLYLSDLLPSYAVPRQIKFYKKIPLNMNGKVDYLSLKEDFERI